MHLDVRPDVVGSSETADLFQGAVRVAGAVYVAGAGVDEEVALAGLTSVGTLTPLISEIG